MAVSKPQKRIVTSTLKRSDLSFASKNRGPTCCSAEAESDGVGSIASFLFQRTDSAAISSAASSLLPTASIAPVAAVSNRSSVNRGAADNNSATAPPGFCCRITARVLSTTSLRRASAAEACSDTFGAVTNRSVSRRKTTSGCCCGSFNSWIAAKSRWAASSADSRA